MMGAVIQRVEAKDTSTSDWCDQCMPLQMDSRGLGLGVADSDRLGESTGGL